MNKKTIARKQLALTAAEQGVTPLETMLRRMRYYTKLADRELEKGDNADRGMIDSALKAAHESAKDAAPYLHPRLSAVEHKDERFDAFAEMLKLIDGTTKGLPDQSKIPPDPDMIDVTPTPLAPEPQALPGAPVPRLPN